MGICLTLEEPTPEKRLEANTAGMYHVWERDYRKLQITTIRELLEEGREPAIPLLVRTMYQRADRVKGRGGDQPELVL